MYTFCGLLYNSMKSTKCSMKRCNLKIEVKHGEVFYCLAAMHNVAKYLISNQLDSSIQKLNTTINLSSSMAIQQM